MAMMATAARHHHSEASDDSPNAWDSPENSPDSKSAAASNLHGTKVQDILGACIDLLPREIWANPAVAELVARPKKSVEIMEKTAAAELATDSVGQTQGKIAAAAELVSDSVGTTAASATDDPAAVVNGVQPEIKDGKEAGLPVVIGKHEADWKCQTEKSEADGKELGVREQVMLCKALLEILFSSKIVSSQLLAQEDCAEVNRLVTGFRDGTTIESGALPLGTAQMRLRIESEHSHDKYDSFPSLKGIARDKTSLAIQRDEEEKGNGVAGGNRKLLSAHRLSDRTSSSRSARNSSEGTGRKSEFSFGARNAPWVPHAENRRLCLFIILEDTRSSIAAKIMGWLMILVIVVTTVSFVLASMPRFRITPEECNTRKEAGLPLTVKACEPVANDVFYYVDAVCIVVFTLDYVLRVICVHADVREGVSSCARTLRYMKDPMNIIDAAAIFPFYVDISFPDAPLGFVKILRLARILRPFKMVKHHDGVKMFADVLKMSAQPLLVLLFFNIMMIVFFGSLMYFAERGKFSVSEEYLASYPTGVFVRSDKQNVGDEVSPFRSIPYSFWFVCVTMTTVGYGDYSPTTYVGKVIGVAIFYVGILFIAFPLGVLSSNFNLVYARYAKPAKKVDLNARVKRQEARSTQFRASLPRHGGEGVSQLCFFPPTGSIRRRVFLALHEPTSCKLGHILRVAMIATIFVSVMAFIFETMPRFMKTPDACVVSNVTVDSCKPEASRSFFYIEAVCTATFTVDYVIRLCLVHGCYPEDAGIFPPDNQDAEPSGCRAADSSSLMPGWKLTLRYLVDPLNIIDFFAIAPFYVELLVGSETLEVVRVVRLARLLRLLKTAKMRLCVDLFANVIKDALPALLTLLFTTMLMCILLSSVMVYAESSSYSVEDWGELSKNHPTGLYIRPTADGHGKEMSPFSSIPYTFWWFFVTSTTVGYGDDYPTTIMGRGVAVSCFYLGIVLLALPLTIIGQSFNKYYPGWVKELKRQGTKDINDPKRENENSGGTKPTRLVAWEEAVASWD